MPTYEYVCKSCGHLFEIVQSMRDDPLTECPECGGELRKVFAPPAISFKGSGFYATDHGKKKGSTTTTDASDTTTAKKGDPGSVETKKESKSAADATSKDASPSTSTSTSGKEGTSGS